MKKICPKCQGSMVEGVVLDTKDGVRNISHWLEGSPIKGWFGLKLQGNKPIAVQTYRCSRCAYLESYAPE